MIESQLPLHYTFPLIGILVGVGAARLYIYIQARELNHVFGYDPDGHPAVATYNSRKNEITHRFKYYQDGLACDSIEENIELLILWVELEELTHWAGHMNAEPGHSNDWMYSLLDVSCYVHGSSAFSTVGDETELIADYMTEEKITNENVAEV